MSQIWLQIASTTAQYVLVHPPGSTWEGFLEAILFPEPDLSLNPLNQLCSTLGQSWRILFWQFFLISVFPELILMALTAKSNYIWKLKILVSNQGNAVHGKITASAQKWPSRLSFASVEPLPLCQTCKMQPWLHQYATDRGKLGQRGCTAEGCKKAVMVTECKVGGD